MFDEKANGQCEDAPCTVAPEQTIQEVLELDVFVTYSCLDVGGQTEIGDDQLRR